MWLRGTRDNADYALEMANNYVIHSNGKQMNIEITMRTAGNSATIKTYT